MKIYVICDNTDYGVAASNIVNRSGNVSIMSEVLTDDVRALMSDLKENTSGAYDMVVLICGNAKDVAISANKLSGVRAVVCKDGDDSSDAVASTRANVIIIDSGRVDKRTLGAIMSGMLQSDEEQTAPTHASSSHTQKHLKEHEPAREREVMQEPSHSSGGGSGIGGFFSDLKESLTTGGPDTPPQPRAKQMSSAKPIQPSARPIQPSARPIQPSARSIQQKPVGPKQKTKVVEDTKEMVSNIKRKGFGKYFKDALGLED